MKIIQEFKDFAMKGNVLDLAVGIIIGGAFGKIVSSFVNDIIMPPLGVLLGGVDFKDLSIPLKYTTDGTVEVALRYGNFVNVTIDFLIIAASIFMMIKIVNKIKLKQEKKEAAKEAELTRQEKLLVEIRDLLKK